MIRASSADPGGTESRRPPTRGVAALRAFGLLSTVMSAVLGSACGGGPCGLEVNKLSGSMSQLYDIEVDRVKARRPEADAIVIEYFHGADIVTKVVANVRAFSKGVKIPLTDGDVTRVTSPPTSFPRDIETGQITFESELIEGSDLQACFSVVFNNDDKTQRTLQGAVSAPLEAK